MKTMIQKFANGFKLINLKSIVMILALTTISLTAFAQKQTSSQTHIKFYSTTPAENIEANNYKSVSTLDTKSGEIVFSVPMQSFEFEKALMQEHFNSKKFLDTKTNPKAKLTGKITNLDKVNFEKDGTYTANITGDLTINGVTKSIAEKATFTIKEGKINLNSVFNITLADYKIAFDKGKPSTNIAKIVEVTAEANY